METSAYFSNFMSCQIDKINLEILSKNDEEIMKWIEVNSSIFRKEWESSICKCCQNVKMCGYKAKKYCENYK